jgi:hypothetical protein
MTRPKTCHQPKVSLYVQRVRVAAHPCYEIDELGSGTWQKWKGRCEARTALPMSVLAWPHGLVHPFLLGLVWTYPVSPCSRFNHQMWPFFKQRGSRANMKPSVTRSLLATASWRNRILKVARDKKCRSIMKFFPPCSFKFIWLAIGEDTNERRTKYRFMVPENDAKPTIIIGMSQVHSRKMSQHMYVKSDELTLTTGWLISCRKFHFVRYKDFQTGWSDPEEKNGDLLIIRKLSRNEASAQTKLINYQFLNSPSGQLL